MDSPCAWIPEVHQDFATDDPSLSEPAQEHQPQQVIEYDSHADPAACI
jgi:hypothetical protein